MKNRLIYSAIISMTLFTSSFAYSETGNIRTSLDNDQRAIGTHAFTASDYKPGAIQHIVLFKYKETTSPAQIKEARERFLALENQAKRNGKPYIQRIEAGSQISGEGVDHDFQEAFIVTFRPKATGTTMLAHQW